MERRKSSPFQSVFYFTVSGVIQTTAGDCRVLKFRDPRDPCHVHSWVLEKTLGKVLHLVKGSIEGSGELVSEYIIRHLYSSGSSLGLPKAFGLERLQLCS